MSARPHGRRPFIPSWTLPAGQVWCARQCGSSFQVSAWTPPDGGGYRCDLHDHKGSAHAVDPCDGEMRRTDNTGWGTVATTSDVVRRDNENVMRVVVVTADDELALVLMRALRRVGVYILHALDVADGLAVCRVARPHVVLVDNALLASEGSGTLTLVRAMCGDHVGLLVVDALGVSNAHDFPAEARVDEVAVRPLVLEALWERIVEFAARATEHHHALLRAHQVQHAAGFSGHAPALAFSSEPRPFSSNMEVVQAVFTVARACASGLLQLEHEESMLQLAFVRGIVVGARDNLREHQLGERLLREGRLSKSDLKKVNDRVARGERVAEAIVAMGLLDPVEALAMLTQQVRERLWRAFSWREGKLSFQGGDDAAAGLAVEGLDLQREIMAWAFFPTRQADAEAFVAGHVAERLVRTRDFDDGLEAYGRLRPGSPLRSVLPRCATMVEVLASAQGHEADLYALWLAGVFRFENDAAHADHRPLPRPSLSDGRGWAVDRAAVSAVAAATLRVRGRSLYDALGVAPDASSEVLAEKIAALEREVGPDVLAGKELGPALQAARDLWTLLVEMRVMLLDSAARAAYDRSLGPGPARARSRSALADTAEQCFLDGQLFLEQGNIAAARGAFEQALQGRPNDPDFNAWLAWASLLAGDDDVFAMDILETTARAYPQAMRPQFFLGLAASRRGNMDAARRHLEEAVARAPTDVEVRRALESVGG